MTVISVPLEPNGLVFTYGVPLFNGVRDMLKVGNGPVLCQQHSDEVNTPVSCFGLAFLQVGLCGSGQPGDFALGERFLGDAIARMPAGAHLYEHERIVCLRDDVNFAPTTPVVGVQHTIALSFEVGLGGALTNGTSAAAGGRH